MANAEQTVPTKGPSRMKRRVIILGSVLVAVAVVWSVFWFIAAAYAERAFLKVVDDGVRQGVALDCVNRRVEGYPFRIELHCGDGTSVTMPEGTVTLSSLMAVALIYNPRHVIAEFGSPAVITEANIPETRVEWSLARASVVLDGAMVDRFALSIREPQVASFGMAQVAAQLAELHLRTNADSADAVDAALRLDGVDAVPGQPPVDVQAIAVLHQAHALFAAAQGGPAMLLAAMGDGVPVELSRLSLAAGDAACQPACSRSAASPRSPSPLSSAADPSRAEGRRPKSGASTSWPASMMPRRMARVRVKVSNSMSPSPQRMARCSADRSSENRPSASITASRLCRKTSRHMVGSEAARRVKSRKPPAENLITSDWVTSSRSSAVPTML